MSGDRHTPAFGKGLKSFGKGFKIFCTKLALAKAIVALGRVGFGKGCHVALGKATVALGKATAVR